jgi:protein-disulfide isomerase
MRRWKLFVGLVSASLLGVSACDRGATEPSPAEERGEEKGESKGESRQAVTAERVPLIGAKIRGSDKALVTIVEMSDYACPFCKKAHATMEALMGEYHGRVRLAVFENPLPFHKTAKPAAKWAFAAGEQGKYWQARDTLFENQKKLDDEGLAALAKDLHLDPERLERDAASQAAERFVQGGLDLAKSLGVKGTPTFFVNGARIIGAQNVGAFRAAIEEALGRANEMVARGVRPENVYSEILKTASPYKPAAAEPAKADGRNCGDGCGEDPKAEPPGEGEIFDVEVGDVPIRGAANAPITIVVFTDFECPFCQKGEATVRAVEKEYGQKVRVAYKSYPLPFHDHARLASKAALAAHRQGKFFEYKEILFAHQDALGRAALLEYAAQAGLDASRFEKDLDDPAIERAIQADEAQVKRLEIGGTPTFFINGRKLAGAQPIAAFRAQIDAVLAGK